MTDSDRSLTPAGAARSSGVVADALDELAVTRRLRRLASAYPAFTFSYAFLGRRGMRWTADRTDRMAPGVRVAITGDLMELHAALQRDKAGHDR